MAAALEEKAPLTDRRTKTAGYMSRRRGTRASRGATTPPLRPSPATSPEGVEDSGSSEKACSGAAGETRDWSWHCWDSDWRHSGWHHRSDAVSASSAHPPGTGSVDEIGEASWPSWRWCGSGGYEAGWHHAGADTSDSSLCSEDDDEGGDDDGDDVEDDVAGLGGLNVKLDVLGAKFSSLLAVVAA